MPVAEHAADLHHRVTGHFALALTPLRFVEVAGRTSTAALIVFSARAKHPDTAMAISHAVARGIPVVMITQREQSDLRPPMSGPSVTVVTVPSQGKDGFLATQSVLVMAAVITRIYSEDLPEVLPSATDSFPEAVKERLLVLHGQEGRAAAVDVETRMHELGLTSVQVADYRNLAHGRHVGLERRHAETTVLALISPSSASLAAKTLATLPDRLTIHRIETSLEGAAATIDLLATVMALPVETAARQSVEPSKPMVSPYGRFLYNLPFKRLYPAQKVGPVLRKVQAAGFNIGDKQAVELYSSAYSDWVAALRLKAVNSLVLDYDGTCVTTAGRFDLPGFPVQDALIGLLASGTPVAFASGRGGSLHEDLRKWVPRQYWQLIMLGLHNGSWRQELSEDLRDSVAESSSWYEGLQDRLQPFSDRKLITLRIRPSQVTVTSNNTEMTSASLRQLVEATIGEDGRFVRVASSGHSVDIVDRRFGKEQILSDFTSKHGSALAIGDQGQPGGNDFALLAASPLTISVDSCSADPTRCWNIATAGSSGPQALVETLSKLTRRKGQLYLSAENSDH
ncbi:hypothetical protein AAur_pTC20247 (plasmid) [Paenarthrobacter aurescens TC1]|uniref:SIS domain-containing protein n=2 Tax=Paenarthrobacter aurescens TaxID=43663 RepID=A1RDT1_PAEAT|nr:hypothetical protein AAur_pTC20247 [Paenarthrobacter aurescens TC1]